MFGRYRIPICNHVHSFVYIHRIETIDVRPPMYVWLMHTRFIGMYADVRFDGLRGNNLQIHKSTKPILQHSHNIQLYNHVRLYLYSHATAASRIIVRLYNMIDAVNVANLISNTASSANRLTSTDELVP